MTDEFTMLYQCRLKKAQDQFLSYVVGGAVALAAVVGAVVVRFWIFQGPAQCSKCAGKEGDNEIVVQQLRHQVRMLTEQVEAERAVGCLSGRQLMPLVPVIH